MPRSRAPDVPDDTAGTAVPAGAGPGRPAREPGTARARRRARALAAHDRHGELRLVVRRASAPTMRRLVAGFLLAYGVAGIALVALTGLVLAGPLVRLGALGTSLETRRAELVRTLEATQTALAGAAGTADRLGTSLEAARSGSSSAATLARGLSGTMRDLSSAAGVSILGAQPLAGLQAGFSTASDQLNELGGQLDGIGTALAANREDAAASGRDIASLRDEVATLIATIRDLELPSIGGSPIDIGVVAIGLLVWLGIPALVSLAAGVALWRSLRRAPVTTTPGG